MRDALLSSLFKLALLVSFISLLITLGRDSLSSIIPSHWGKSVLNVSFVNYKMIIWDYSFSYIIAGTLKVEI